MRSCPICHSDRHACTELPSLQHSLGNPENLLGPRFFVFVTAIEGYPRRWTAILCETPLRTIKEAMSMSSEDLWFSLVGITTPSLP